MCVCVCVGQIRVLSRYANKTIEFKIRICNDTSQII